MLSRRSLRRRLDRLCRSSVARARDTADVRRARYRDGMPLQNRVTPGGELIATSARGTLMGNRGILHDDNKEIVRTSRNMMWLICRLEFKGRRRPLMSPGTYTELFFLDEAVALSAGHRPCGECRRSQYRSYMDAVNQGSEEPLDGPKDLDRRLNESRRAMDNDCAGDLARWRLRHSRRRRFPADLGRRSAPLVAGGLRRCSGDRRHRSGIRRSGDARAVGDSAAIRLSGRSAPISGAGRSGSRSGWNGRRRWRSSAEVGHFRDVLYGCRRRATHDVADT